MIRVDYGAFTQAQRLLFETLYVKGFGMDQALAYIGRLTPGQVSHYLQEVDGMTFAQVEASLAEIIEAKDVDQIELDFTAGQDGLIQSTAAVVAENHRRRSSDV